MAFSIAPAGEILKYLGKKGTVLVDLRDEEEFQKAHIATAINIPYEVFEEKKDRLKNYKVVIFYCERGNTSLLTARDYNNNFQLILTLSGGFNGNIKKFAIDGQP